MRYNTDIDVAYSTAGTPHLNCFMGPAYACKLQRAYQDYQSQIIQIEFMRIWPVPTNRMHRVDQETPQRTNHKFSHTFNVGDEVLVISG